MPRVHVSDEIQKVIEEVRGRAHVPPPMPQSLYIGVDPGGSGGVATVGLMTGTYSLKDATEQEVWQWFQSLKGIGKYVEVFAVIEKVGGFIASYGGEKKNVAAGHTTFKFGQSYGMLRMCLVASGISFEEVTPQAWQKGMGIPPRKKGGTGKVGEKKHQFKGRLKARAQQLFPSENVTLAVCDALLLATYCQRKRTGTL